MLVSFSCSLSDSGSNMLDRKSTIVVIFNKKKVSLLVDNCITTVLSNYKMAEQGGVECCATWRAIKCLIHILKTPAKWVALQCVRAKVGLWNSDESIAVVLHIDHM